MPEKLPVENTEQPKEIPAEETPKEESMVEPSKEEKEREFTQKIENEEPKTRFPKKEQTSQEKEEGYWKRQAKKLKEKIDLGESIESNDLVDEDDKPITRKEFNEMIEESNKKQSSESMLQEFLVEKPEYRKYAPLLRKHLNDPAYHNIPIGFIANGIKGDYMDEEINERADLKKKADEEANQSKSLGSSKRSIPGKKKSVWDMSKDEFEQHQADILKRNIIKR
jgi:hypothetical protein